MDGMTRILVEGEVKGLDYFIAQGFVWGRSLYCRPFLFGAVQDPLTGEWILAKRQQWHKPGGMHAFLESRGRPDKPDMPEARVMQAIEMTATYMLDVEGDEFHQIHRRMI